MDNRQQTSNPETRRRRLDDLFGDEPHLSPTMKARRLHEKMHVPEIVSIEEITAEGLKRTHNSTVIVCPETLAEVPTQAVLDSTPRLQIICYEESAPEKTSQQNTHIPLADAAVLLRTGCSAGNDQPAHAEQLERFREQVLMQWLKGAPCRDTDLNRRSKILGTLG